MVILTKTHSDGKFLNYGALLKRRMSRETFKTNVLKHIILCTLICSTFDVMDCRAFIGLIGAIF